MMAIPYYHPMCLEEGRSSSPGFEKGCRRMPSACLVADLGRIDYGQALAWQESLVLARLQGLVGDVLLFCEHPPVFTLGRGGRRASILVSPEVLDRLNIPMYEVNRGGDITYHGPGQVVAYPILCLEAHLRDMHLYLHNLEEIVISALAFYNITARRFIGYTGVWVGDKKISAIGVATKRWVTMHGFALNVAPNMSHFAMIAPCGITDFGVTSMREVLGCEVHPGRVKERLIEAFEKVFNSLAEYICPEDLQGIVDVFHSHEVNNSAGHQHRSLGFAGRRMTYS